jgi:hypothetical protein
MGKSEGRRPLGKLKVLKLFQDRVVCTGLIWLRIRRSGGML